MRLLKTILICIFLPAAAMAQDGFGDCTDSGYLSGFPLAETAPTILCVEHFRIPITGAGGDRSIRAISDVSAGWAIPPNMLAAIENGARLAAQAMPSLGRFSIDDVTLLILDDALDFRPDRRVLGVADGRPRADGTRPRECLVTLFGLTLRSDLEVATTTAHEIFHCLQYASLSAAQMGTYGSGGEWWIEGSAEYFAGLAVPGSTDTTGRGSEFQAAVDAGIPLYELAHDSAPFFHWLGGQRGPSGLLPFLSGMSSSGSEAAQRAAMRAALSDDLWLNFAEAYIDNAIPHPAGGTVAVSPTPFETLTVSSPGIQRLVLKPFVLRFATVDYTCGTWGNRVSPDDANISLREESATDWSDWPDEIDVAGDRPSTYWFAGMRTAEGNLTVEDDVERRRACQPCGPTDQLDVCLNGVWQMTSGGPIAWMQAQGLPITNVAEGPRIISLLSDGRYSTDPFEFAHTLQGNDEVGEVDAGAVAAHGRWSAQDGRLYICQDAGGVGGTATVRSSSGSGTQSVSQVGGGMLNMTYSCSETSMETQMPIPGMAPMATGYSKIAVERPSP